MSNFTGAAFILGLLALLGWFAYTLGLWPGVWGV